MRDLVLRKYVPGAKTECIYHRSKLPGCIPCVIGKAQEPRTLSLFEHLNGTHWDGCNYGGWLATGHASLNTHVGERLRGCRVVEEEF